MDVTIGEAARRSGVHIETIRYYEREKIIPKPIRTDAGRRLYDDAAIGRLSFVRRCREMGFPMKQVRILMQLKSGGLSPDDATSCNDARIIGEAHIVEVRQKIAELQQLERSLGTLIEQCKTNTAACPMLSSLFAEQT